ncbi:MAG: T9SS type A sorting domain-containing protein [Bacteroidales bacterium]|nr:T9SS type A sorting domain-containing protein [Bacteroidales bacterium]
MSKYFFIELIILIFCQSVFSQAKITIDSSYIVYNGGTTFDPIYINVSNGNSDAISKLSTGFIISSNEYQYLNWHIGTNTGTYEFPFGANGIYTPVELNVSTSGVGPGVLSVSTWYSAGNTDLPDGGYSLCIDESNVVDRFWTIDFKDYLTNPIMDVKLHYNVNELDGNLESDLLAQSGDLSLSCTWNAGRGYINENDNYIELKGISKDGPWIISSEINTLPIEMLSFDAFWSTEEANVVNIEWLTSTETNNEYFLIERSLDGQTFLPIGVQESQGNSKNGSFYTFQDLNPPQEGIIYYRLKQFDFDGTSSESEIISLESSTKSVEFTVYPNPSNKYFNINIQSNQEDIFQLLLFDLTGRIIYSNSISVSGFETSHTIDASEIPSGTYVLQITSQKRTEIINEILIKTD